MRILVVFLLILVPVSAVARDCTYSTYKWNTIERKAVEYKQVKKLYSQLTEKEIEPFTGCSVCIEDQVEITFGSLKPIKVCRVLATAITRTLEEVQQSGMPIIELVAYRVGLTRGDIDEKGNRTKFSNHSFGTAIDINASFNGLYDNCIEFGENCRLIKGGRWDPKQPESITAESTLVKLMSGIGLKWGGEIKGKQKDFMHFSLSGY